MTPHPATDADLLAGAARFGTPAYVHDLAALNERYSALAAAFPGFSVRCAIKANPNAAIATNLDLAARLGRFLPELQPWLAVHPAPIEALAAAWVDRTEAQLALIEALGTQAAVYRYEDMLAAPAATLVRVYALLRADAQTDDQIAGALSAEPRRGLGDWKTYATATTGGSLVGRWTRPCQSNRLARSCPALPP